MTILPILFIVSGLGELSNVVLWIRVTAVLPPSDLEQRARETPPKRLIKAQTLRRQHRDADVGVVLRQKSHAC